jgi:tRNA(Met) C34 N-acetyltransferase TmcA
MCVLQDFEALTPNLLARTIETVEGGGLVVLLLKTMSSLKQLYTMTMVRRSHLRVPFAYNYFRMYMLGIGRRHTRLSLPALTNVSSSRWALAKTV